MKIRQRLILGLAPLLTSLMMAAPAAAAAADTSDRAAIQTNMGTIVVQLEPSRAPITVKNFKDYVNDKFYDGTVFHRVINGFMIQGGGFTPAMHEKATRAPIALEARGDLPNDRYTIAMARTSYPHSATSQFFINVADNDFLNANPAAGSDGYAVFGRVVKGMDVVDKIAQVPTHTQGFMQNVPAKPVIIESIRLVK